LRSFKLVSYHVGPSPFKNTEIGKGSMTSAQGSSEGELGV
jgi:hypothetical protein